VQAHLLAADLSHGLPRPPPRSQRSALPVTRFGGRPEADRAQPAPLPALHRAQVPEDRSAPSTSEPEPPCKPAVGGRSSSSTSSRPTRAEGTAAP
jgi:hypothetical protein